jgi:ABC-type enterobactin transport system permease subunit
MTHRHASAAVRTWRWPVVLTTIGLVAALFSEGGPGDMLANACLAVPAVVGLWFGWGRRR